MNKEMMKQSLECKKKFEQAIDYNYGLKLKEFVQSKTVPQLGQWLKELPDRQIALLNHPMNDEQPFPEEALFALYAYADYLRVHATLEESS